MDVAAVIGHRQPEFVAGQSALRNHQFGVFVLAATVECCSRPLCRAGLANAHQTLKAVVGEPEPSAPGVRSSSPASTLKKVALGVGAACCVLFSALVWQTSQRPDSAGSLKNYLSANYLGADYRTGIGERRVLTLSDQSTLFLNTFSAVNIHYTDKQRVIQLLQGEIKIQVAKDPARPLIVSTRHGSATALGTRYSVYDQGNATSVQVLESLVQVCADADVDFDAPSCERLAAGQATSVTDGGVGSPRAIDRDFEHDWMANQLVVSDQPLSRVLDELSRYHWGLIKMDRELLRDLRVSGVFPLGDPLRALAALEQSLPIEITRYSPLLTVVKPR